MKKYITGVLMITVIGLMSCGKSDLDFEQDDNFSQMGGDSTLIVPDTVGVHPFLGNKYMVINAKEQRLLYYSDQAGMYRFKPIALPESDNISKDIYPVEIQDVMFDCTNNNLFLGYPVGIEVAGNPLIVVERRVSENSVNDYSDGAFLSYDDQSGWQLTDFFKYAPYGGQFMTSRPMIGKTHDGKIIVKSQVGVLISEDNGRFWTHNPRAYEGLDDSEYVAIGASMAFHKELGMFFATGHRKMKDDTIKSAIFSIHTVTGEVSEVRRDWIPNIIRYDSKGDTISETAIQQAGSPVFYVVDKNRDPELSAYDGYIIGFSVYREKVYQFVYAYRPGDTWDDVEFTVTQTTMRGSLSRHSPPGLIYNPETNKFEIIHSSPYELSLYSTEVDNVLNLDPKSDRVEWKKEASLLQREVTVRGQGMYPISSIVDRENKVQRIYIDMGDEYPGRSGIFELTRTLKTDELSIYVRDKRNFINSQIY